MADKISKERRSYTMSCIHSNNTKPELIVRKFLFSRGFRFRINDKRLPGKPDIVLRKYKTVIFINGCFWHGHNCAEYRPPKTHKKFWANKIICNKERDEKVRTQLKQMGWNTMVIWTCQLKPTNQQQTLEEIETLLCKVLLTSVSIKRARPYKLDEINRTIAAENPITYGGKTNN